MAEVLASLRAGIAEPPALDAGVAERLRERLQRELGEAPPASPDRA